LNTESIIAVVISNDRPKQDAMGQVFTGLPGIKVVVESADFTAGVQKVQSMSADVAVVFLDDRPEVGCTLLAKLKQARPDLFTFAISGDRSAELIVKAIRAGADELLSAIPSSEEILAPVVKLMELRRRDRSSGERVSTLISAYSSRGGAGVTTMMVNLATSIRRLSGRDVCLVDLDFQNGDVPVYLNFKHPYSILDITEHIENLDPAFVQGTLYQHASGVHVLAPPPMLEDGESISARDVSQILRTLKTQYEFVLVDTSSFLHDMTFSVIEAAQRCFLVTDNMVPSVRAMQRVVNTLERLGINNEHLFLTVNKPTEKSDISSQDIAEVVKLDVAYTLPRDEATAIQAANRGLSLYETNPKSLLVQAIDDLARSIAGVSSASKGKGSRIFGRFFAESRP